MSEERVGGERAGQEVVEEQGGDVVSHDLACSWVYDITITGTEGRLISDVGR